jgi:hypothetical protein
MNLATRKFYWNLEIIWFGVGVSACGSLFLTSEWYAFLTPTLRLATNTPSAVVISNCVFFVSGTFAKWRLGLIPRTIDSRRYAIGLECARSNAVLYKRQFD